MILGTQATVVPCPIASADVYRLAREEALFGVGVDVLAEFAQAAAEAERRQVQQRPHQGGRKVPEALLGPPFALDRLQIGEARSARQGAAPHQAVAKDGPLEKFTEGKMIRFSRHLSKADPQRRSTSLQNKKGQFFFFLLRRLSKFFFFLNGQGRGMTF